MIFISSRGLMKGGNLNFFLELEQDIKKEMKKLENEGLDRFLSKQEEFVLDRFEGDIAILENRRTKQFLEINKKDLPKEIKEGDILNKINDEFVKNIEKNKEVSERIRKKMEDLWE